MDKAHRIKVMIADDHTLVRQGLRALVESQQDMDVVVEAANGAEALIRYLQSKPDVSLIDLHMPVSDGVEAIAAILGRVPDAAVVCLTSLGGDDYVYRALRAGARGYILKNAPRENLFDCIRTVAQGGKWIAPDAAAKLADRITQPELSPREFEVLKLLATASSNKQIAVSLGISAGTAKVHVNNILKKLGTDSRMAAVNLARKRGLVHPEA